MLEGTASPLEDGIIIKIILKIEEMCWGTRTLLFSRVRHGAWAGVINTNQQHSHKREATTHIAVLQQY